MRTLKVTSIATVVGTAVGLGAWLSGLGRMLWPGHPQLACFLLTIVTGIVVQVSWPKLIEPDSE